MILDVEEYPNWKARVFKVVARMMGLKAQHMLFVDINPGGDVEYTPPPPCKTCEETGRLMTVTTYTIIDCPRCYGRG
jgi:hypothetical protein